ncbi:recombinase family protein [Streptomyces sp. NPDC007851]|uniref:recombinase family protein n=1 Tax=Streptomyces sp. NPDC007851 TaxID=3155008 RepID=UPI00340CE0AD
MHNLVAVQRTGLIPVASYARTSEDFRQRDGRGVRHQLRVNERTVEQQECRVVAAYADNGLSASRPGVTRPGFDRLLGDLVSGRTPDGQEIRGVVCVADDRLYRRPEDLSRFYASLTAREGRVYLDPQGVRDPYSQEGLLQAVRSLEAAVCAPQRSAAVRLAGGQDRLAPLRGGVGTTGDQRPHRRQGGPSHRTRSAEPSDLCWPAASSVLE